MRIFKKKTSSGGFTHVEGLFLLILIAAVAFTGVLVYRHASEDSYKSHASSWSEVGNVTVSYNVAATYKNIPWCEPPCNSAPTYLGCGSDTKYCGLGSKRVTSTVVRVPYTHINVVACVQHIGNTDKVSALAGASHNQFVNDGALGTLVINGTSNGRYGRVYEAVTSSVSSRSWLYAVFQEQSRTFTPSSYVQNPVVSYTFTGNDGLIHVSATATAYVSSLRSC